VEGIRLPHSIVELCNWLCCFYFESVTFIYVWTHVQVNSYRQTLKMSAHAKKRKIDTKCRIFNKAWTAKYLFTEVKGKALCLVCGAQVAVFKDYNLNQHYATKHAEKYKN